MSDADDNQKQEVCAEYFSRLRPKYEQISLSYASPCQNLPLEEVVLTHEPKFTAFWSQFHLSPASRSAQYPGTSIWPLRKISRAREIYDTREIELFAQKFLFAR